ncbi:MAG: hypothetical protein V7K48_00800 [Nostoc sp.]
MNDINCMDFAQNVAHSDRLLNLQNWYFLLQSAIACLTKIFNFH